MTTRARFGGFPELNDDRGGMPSPVAEMIKKRKICVLYDYSTLPVHNDFDMF